MAKVDTDMQKRMIRHALIEKLNGMGKGQPYYLSLVDDYIELWKIKELLIEDITERGVSIHWSNGPKQGGYKKNDSVSELTKVNGQMLKILADLGLRASDLKVEPNERL